MENWYLINKPENYNIIKDNENLTSFQKILLANRDIVDEYKINSIFNSSVDNLHSSLKMKDMKKGVDILLDSMMKEEKILISGDYDQDGVAATVILYKGLNLFYDNISYAIPDRIEDGYGLNKNIVDDCIENDIRLIITCDNGIAAFEAIEYARENGIRVIVTDHHEVVNIDGKDVLPNADAVINPHRMDDDYPFDGICGAVVAYKFIDAIIELYGSSLGIKKQSIYFLLQYAMLGTVCDMMKIVDENRIIVVEGLKIINQTKNLGIKSLLREINWQKDVDIYTVGFLIGPIINASGRIYTAKLGVELLLTNDEEEAMTYSKTLVELNNERKEMTQKSVEVAIEKIEYENIHKNDIIIVYDSSIHESICGLVAGRIKDRYNKPTLVLTDSSNDGIIKGSGRSINAYNMFEHFNKFRDDFVAFGGHAMACGLSIEKTKLDKFNKNIQEDSGLVEEDFRKIIDLDYGLNFNNINKNLINQINALKPYGYGFAEPIFASKNVIVKDVFILGKDKNVLKFNFEQNGENLQAISFRIDDIIDKLKISINEIYNIKNKEYDIVYKIGENTFNGYTNIQLNLISMR
ncbi:MULTISPECIES: single-stranded-DNA-specific exonuclease RecJ [Helcococcus]|uniref:Single-stranded-DNA-specific exonuclease RecJ n=1 Tax=Helcococcus bovis TaxID=3153252 RepID=A0ABW9F4R2_9FIRM